MCALADDLLALREHRTPHGTSGGGSGQRAWHRPEHATRGWLPLRKRLCYTFSMPAKHIPSTPLSIAITVVIVVLVALMARGSAHLSAILLSQSLPITEEQVIAQHVGGVRTARLVRRTQEADGSVTSIYFVETDGARVSVRLRRPPDGTIHVVSLDDLHP